MRDALFLMMVLSSLVIALRYPFAGVLVWAWFTLMTPHQIVYGTFGIPVNMLIAAVTLGSIFVNAGVRSFKPDVITILMILFSFWLIVSQNYSLAPDASATFFDRFFKTMLFIVICSLMATTRLRIHALIWTMVLAIGFFAVKGALFTLVTLGAYRVQGLENTILYDNNHMALAIATTMPLMLYLHSQVSNKLIRMGLVAMLCLSLMAVLGTQSRGGFICLTVFGAFFWLRSRYKVAIGIGMALVAIPAIAFMPAQWTERMGTITSASEDESFMGRVDAWKINAELADKYPVTGVGLRNSYDADLAATVVDEDLASRARAAHSIYFEILGGTGYVGFALYMAILIAGIWSALRLQRNGKTVDGKPHWTGEFGRYAQISIVVFCVGGAAASMEMWDGYLLIITMIAATLRISEKRQSIDLTNSLANKRFTWRIAARGYRPKRRKRALMPAE